jgi:N-acyl-D-amino-acid deacylase
MDPRWREVTIGHLVEHAGGWDREQAGDPMFRSAEIARALGRPGPPGPREIIEYMIGQPVQFEPGARHAYSNFGYCLLGRVIETASGKPYFEYLRDDILAPMGIRRVTLGRTRPRDRDPREPAYDDPGRGPDVMEPGARGEVPAPDGTFCLESMDAHGGLIAPAADVARFVDAYRLDGEPRAGRPASGCLFGSLPGTFTMALQRTDGVTIVALFNRRTDPSGLDYLKIRDLLERAAGDVASWPSGEEPPPEPFGRAVGGEDRAPRAAGDPKGAGRG